MLRITHSVVGSLVILGTASFLSPSWAGETIVHSASDAKTAITAAQPGDTVVFADGDYDLGKITLMVAGSESKPVRFKAQNGGKARLVGATGFILRRAAHVTLSGFDFATEGMEPVQILGSQEIRLTENRFRIKEIAREGKNAFRWVNITGDGKGNEARNSEHIRIDHNRFEEKHIPGNFIGVSGLGGPDPKPQVATYVQIDHNVFRDIGPRIPNGLEAIRIGLSGMSLSSGHAVVENNLFEECDGDPEVISIKCCDTVVRNNRFVRCQGGVCLRHGNRNMVSGNVFLGENKKGTDGVRVYGDDHTVRNNYFEGLTGPALTVSNGDYDYGVDYASGALPSEEILRSHLRPRRIVLSENAAVRCTGTIIELGHAFGDKTHQLPAQDIRFEKNTLSGGTKPLIEQRTVPERLIWRDNTAILPAGAELGIPGLKPENIRVVPSASAPTIPRAPTSVPGTVGPSWLPR